MRVANTDLRHPNRSSRSRRSANATPDLVVLAPGFLGFARLGGFYYFADRLVAVLRGLLEEALGYTVPVVPCTVLPTDSLERRQGHLLQFLSDLSTEKLSGVERIHLVGHSTGGVDTQLLASKRPLASRAWRGEAARVHEKITSVATVSAPHYGTGLADSWLASWGEDPVSGWLAAVPEGLQLAYQLLKLLPQEAPAIARLKLAHPRDVLAFLWQVSFHRELIADLRPASMERVRATVAPDPDVALTCFVTAVEPRDDSGRSSDRFFRELYRLTKGSDEKGSDAVERCTKLLLGQLESRPELVICSASSRMPASIEPGLNDGVVNSVRQLVDPDDPSQIGGFVIADHADVLGHYDRQDSLIEGRPYNAGLFHSGAGFGDDEFFRLYRRVAGTILRTIPEAAAEPGPGPRSSKRGRRDRPGERLDVRRDDRDAIDNQEVQQPWTRTDLPIDRSCTPTTPR